MRCGPPPRRLRQGRGSGGERVWEGYQGAAVAPLPLPVEAEELVPEHLGRAPGALSSQSARLASPPAVGQHWEWGVRGAHLVQVIKDLQDGEQAGTDEEPHLPPDVT